MSVSTAAGAGGVVRGAAIVLGDQVNTDELHPSRFFSLDDGVVRDGFLGAVSRPIAGAAGDAPRIVVGGRNLGCGSSRETTVRAFRLAGVHAVVAQSFGRIFFRNLVNVGILAFRLTEPATGIRDGDLLALDPARRTLEIVGRGRHLELARSDPFYEAVAARGGVVPFVIERLGRGAAEP